MQRKKTLWEAVMNFAEATVVVDRWIQQQIDMPAGSFLGSGRKSKTDRWIFEVHVTEPATGKPFVILVLTPEADGVSIITDRRAAVSALLSNSSGFERESRLFRVAEIKTSNTPRWFVKMVQSPNGFDPLGVDGFAKIRVTDERTLKVPIDVKSSIYRARKYFEQYPERRGLFAAIAVLDSQSDDEVRATLYTELDNIRDSIKWSGRSIKEAKEKISNEIFGRTR